MKISVGLLFSDEKVITIWVTSYNGNMMIYAIFRKDEWFSLFPKCCEYIVFIGVLLSTHLLLEDSQYVKANRLQLPWSKANQENSVVLFSYLFHFLLDIHFPYYCMTRTCISNNFQKSLIIQEPNSLSKHR